MSTILKISDLVTVITLQNIFCKIEIQTDDAIVIKTTLFNEPPQWSKGAIWYQLFVERFRNGLSEPIEADKCCYRGQLASPDNYFKLSP